MTMIERNSCIDIVWLNLVERWFRDITLNRIRCDAFTSLAQLQAAIYEYISHNNETPKPFVWTQSADDIINKVNRRKALLEHYTSIGIDVSKEHLDTHALADDVSRSFANSSGSQGLPGRVGAAPRRLLFEATSAWSIAPGTGSRFQGAII